MKIIVSKKADILAKLYDLYHAPSIQENTPYYIVTLGSLSQIFYYGYVFDRFNIWDKLFDALIRVRIDGESSRYLDDLEKIDLYRWDLVGEELRMYGEKLVKEYETIEQKIKTLLTKILGIKTFFREEYLVLAFNPLKSLIGSVPRTNLEEKYIVTALFVRPDVNIKRAIDLFIHETLHGLIRLNNINIPEEVEEEFIDTLCPEGYLSRELGLTNTINVGEGNLQALIARYFEDKLYDKMTLLRYLAERGSLHYI